MRDLRFHGNGFIQVVLNPVTRMHIYSPHFLENFPRVENARIHDHKFTFVSQVLYGRLHNMNYDMKPDFGEHGLYRVDAETNKLRRTGSCRSHWFGTDIIKAGESYEFGGPLKFHDTYADELTVTVMTKTHAIDSYEPQVICINDEPNPDDAFGTQPEYGHLRREVQRVMRILT